MAGSLCPSGPGPAWNSSAQGKGLRDPCAPGQTCNFPTGGALDPDCPMASPPLNAEGDLHDASVLTSVTSVVTPFRTVKDEETLLRIQISSAGARRTNNTGLRRGGTEGGRRRGFLVSASVGRSSASLGPWGASEASQWPGTLDTGVTGLGGRVCWLGGGQTLGRSAGAPVGSLLKVPPTGSESAEGHVQVLIRTWNLNGVSPPWRAGFGFFWHSWVSFPIQSLHSCCAPAPALSASPLRLWGQAR